MLIVSKFYCLSKVAVMQYCLLLGLLVCSSLSYASSAYTPPPVPALAAGSYILVEADTGFVIAEHYADEPRPPASLTKIMSGYMLSLYLESGLLLEEERVKVSKNAWAQNPAFANSSLMWIEPGKTVRLIDLYLGMVVSSGNDAAVAVAEHISGTEKDFVRLINREAKALGMTNTVFANSHGLTAKEKAHTTARDMAILTRAIIHRSPKYYRYYAEREFTYNGIRQKNRNILLGKVEGVDGVKTGYTEAAGYCLVTSAKREGMRLIAVTLGSTSKSDRVRDSRVLLEYGFRYYRLRTPLYAGEDIDKVYVYGGDGDLLSLGVSEDVHVLLPRGQDKDLSHKIHLNGYVVAPIEVNTVVGTLDYWHNNKKLTEVPLVALKTVEYGSWFKRIFDWFRLRLVLFVFGDGGTS